MSSGHVVEVFTGQTTMTIVSSRRFYAANRRHCDTNGELGMPDGHRVVSIGGRSELVHAGPTINDLEQVNDSQVSQSASGHRCGPSNSYFDRVGAL